MNVLADIRRQPNGEMVRRRSMRARTLSRGAVSSRYTSRCARVAGTKRPTPWGEGAVCVTPSSWRSAFCSNVLTRTLRTRCPFMTCRSMCQAEICAAEMEASTIASRPGPATLAGVT